MSSWIGSWRRFLGFDDRRRAFEREAGVLSRATAATGLDPALAAEMTGVARSGASALLGASVQSRDVEIRIPLREVGTGGHTVVLGGTGSGKSRLVGGIIRDAISALGREPGSMGIVVIDHKSELVDLVRALAADVAIALPPDDRNALLSNIVVIDPFSPHALVPWQILEREPGVPTAAQAFEITSLVNRLGGAELGVRQDEFTFTLLLHAIETGKSLVQALRLLDDPLALAAEAASSPSEEVRSYFRGMRMTAQSLDGVRVRLRRLLRLPATRLMLGARGRVSFREMMRGKIVLVALGNPPLGCEDIARFWSGLVTLKFIRGIFERTPADARFPVLAVVDEWQEGLLAGGDIATDYERVLSQARSRSVSLVLVSQSLAGASKVSSTLPKIVLTNTDRHCLFRSSAEDAAAMKHLLGVGGRRPRPVADPWEERSRSPFLTAAEEMQVLVTEAASLPRRTAYWWDRNKPYPAVLIRSAEVAVSELGLRFAERDPRLRDGALAVPIPELERQLEAALNPPFRPLGPPLQTTGAPPTRRRRPAPAD